tara:strand:+ start:794 stop:964 length:171 start_codon:yes stop_codon:yes gene_type:complete
MLKPLLLELSIREVRQVGEQTNSLKLPRFSKIEFEQDFDYRLIEIYKLDDFNQVFD